MQPHLAPAIEKATRKQFPNGIEPHGTDALRFTFASLATQSRDIRFDLGRVGGYRNFCNKLWNAARFVLMMTEDKPVAPRRRRVSSHVVDRWIVSRLGEAIATTDEALRRLPLRHGAPPRCTNSPGMSSATGTWSWPSRCCKGDDAAAAAPRAARCSTVLEALLRALHPIMPFITEEIWQRIAPAAGVPGDTIMLAPWPRAAALRGRRRRGGRCGLDEGRDPRPAPDPRRDGHQPGQAPGAAGAGLRWPMTPRASPATPRCWAGWPASRPSRCWPPARPPRPAPAAVVGNLTLLVPMQGLIDPAAELARLQKKQEKNQQEIKRALAKLENPNFVSNAPPEVVATERERIAQFEKVNESLARQMETVRGLVPR